MATRDLFFDERFLDRHAGAIIADPAIAITELVANAWDAFATDVQINWPQRTKGLPFSIADNGKGMTPEQFEKRWGTIDYNRVSEEGSKSTPPADLEGLPVREAYGRNGRGRHAAFLFAESYTVRTWRDGTEVTYEVRRAADRPFVFERVSKREKVEGHGTEICALGSDGVALAADVAREVLGTRFLADPNFSVFLDGTRITFDDIPKGGFQESKVEIPEFGTAQVTIIDSKKTDRTSRQHGIAWWVKID